MNRFSIWLATAVLWLLATSVWALDPHFLAPVDYTVGSNPQSLCIADFNKDGKPDLATVNTLGNDVSILMNNGDGTFAAAVSYAVGTHPTAACIIDVDDDSWPDLAVTNYGSASISILMNLTDGTFDPAVNYNCGIQPNSICAADLDGDLKIDLAVANFGSGDVSVMINLNNSKFPTAVSYATGNNPFSICSADFNADGRPDLAVVNASDNNVSILRNTGSGIYAAAVNYPVGTYPVSIAAADVNANGTADLAVANSGSNTASILINNGGGVFAAAVDYDAGSSPSSILAADLDKDGRPDLAVANMTVDSISVLRNNGNGTYSAALTHVAGLGPQSIGSADMNGDLMPDLAVANSSSWTVSVLIGVRQWKITASAGANGAIAPTGIVGVYEGTDQTFAVNPNTGYHVANVIVDGLSIGPVTSHTFFGIAGNHTISATFAINTYTITASAGPNGSITPSGITVVNYGGGQTYNIVPASCYHVLDVTVDSVSVGPVTTYPYTNVSANHTIEATFAINVHTITATAGIHGSINPSGPVSVNCGSDKSFTIVPDSAFYVKDVMVDDVSVGAVTNHTITHAVKDYTIAATFSCCGNLTGNVDCSTGDGVDIGDLTALIDNLFITFTPLCCEAEANCDGVGGVDIGDLTALIDNLFITFTQLAACQ